MTHGQKKRVREETGQVLVISVVFLVVLVAMAGAVVDVGSWYYQHRKLQATADAAALAGAQGLIDGTAVNLATQYGDKNGGGVAADDITLSATKVPNDTIRVVAAQDGAGRVHEGVWHVLRQCEGGGDGTRRRPREGPARGTDRR